MHDIHELLDLLWNDYIRLNPHAAKVHELLEACGETTRNDHIAFRTYRHERVGIRALAAAFESMGYTAREEYDFPEKKLYAQHFEHDDAQLPRVFISELKVAEFDAEFQRMVERLVAQVPADLPGRWDFAVSGRPWKVSYSDYELLLKQSEYGAWLAAFGFRANHFTVDVNALQTFDSLQSVNAFLKQHDIALNEAGGEIKGSREVYLEQSSTLAGEVEVDFSDGPRTIPACYYEFARRYPMPDGKLFTGFVARSADKIFQSTDRR